MFAYTPLISGNWMEITQIGFFALFGIYAINCLVQNYAEGPLKIWHYPLLILGILGTFYPLNILANLIGAILITVVVVFTHKYLINENLNEGHAKTN